MLDGAHFDTAPMIIESLSGRARRSAVLHVEERCNANASACVRLALSESSVRSNEQPYGDQRQKYFHEDGSPDEVTRHSAALKACRITSKIRLNAASAVIRVAVTRNFLNHWQGSAEGALKIRSLSVRTAYVESEGRWIRRLAAVQHRDDALGRPPILLRSLPSHRSEQEAQGSSNLGAKLQARRSFGKARNENSWLLRVLLCPMGSAFNMSRTLRMLSKLATAFTSAITGVTK